MTEEKNRIIHPPVMHFTVAGKKNALHFINEELSVLSFINNLTGMVGIIPAKDGETITTNLETSNMFLKNPQIRNEFVKAEKHKQCFGTMCKLPETGNEFLKYYFESDGNAFFNRTERWINLMMSAKNKSKEMETMLAHYAANCEHFKKLEENTAKKMEKLLANSFDLEGIIYVHLSIETSSESENKKPVKHIKVHIDKEEGKISGYRHYYFGIRNDIRMMTLPTWMGKKFWKFIGLYALATRFQKKENEQRKKMFYKTHVLIDEYLPDSIIEDIVSWFKQNMNFDFGNKRKVKGENLIVKALQKITSTSNKFTTKKRELILMYHLVYNSSGLSLSLTNAFSKGEKENVGHEKPILNHEDFAKYGCDIDRFNKLIKKRSEMGFTLKTLLRNFEGTKIVEEIQAKQPFILEGIIPTKNSEGGFKWNAYKAITKMPDIEDCLEEMIEFRSWIEKNLTQLSVAARLIDYMEKRAEEWKVPITIPEMVNENRLSFEKLYPIQLIGRTTTSKKTIAAKHIKAISFGNHYFNGNLTGLTGENAGGKTVCKETVILNLALAQAGLPVIGTNFKFSPKSTIGSVFLERSEGSTMQELTKKTKMIFEAIEKEGTKNVLVILDEIGSGTSPSAALIYGEKVLKELFNHGVSVLFSTQYDELAEKLEKDGVATIFHINERHVIKKGTKSPDIEKFLKREKFDVKINV